MRTLLQIIPEDRVAENFATPWLTAILFGCVILIAMVNVIRKERILRLITAVVNIRALQEWYRDQQEALQGFAYLMVLVSLVVTSTLFYLSQFAFPSAGLGLNFLQILGIVALIFAIRTLFLIAMQDLVDGRFGLLIYRFEYVVVSQVQGLVVLPVLILGTYIGKQYAPTFLGIGLGLIAAFFLFRILRGIAHALRLRVPLFYIIFYLCALEFLPLAVLASMVFR